MPGLVLLFILLPAVELYLLLKVGSSIGALSTFAVVVVTGIVGAAKVKAQGLQVLRQIQGELHEGQLPALSVFEGLLLFLAGALLITPGFLTDAFGFSVLIPPLRRRLARALSDRAVVHAPIAAQGWPLREQAVWVDEARSEERRDVIDVEARVVPKEDGRPG